MTSLRLRELLRLSGRIVSAAGAFTLTLGLCAWSWAVCELDSVQIIHPTANLGAFTIDEWAGNATGPRLRFWQYGNYAGMNQGVAGQHEPDTEWLISPMSKGLAGWSPSDFILYQANWGAPGVKGCPAKEGSRTVVEISHLHNEGLRDHYAYYLIASVGRTGASYNFDRVSPARIKARPIPTPQPAGAEPSARKGFMEVTLGLGEARSYGDAGAPNLIAGYNLYYVNDREPSSSHAGSYRPVLDPSNPSSPLPMVPHGAGSVRVAVPVPQQASYFVTELVYADPVRLVSNGTSGHSSPVAPPGGGSEEPEPEPEEEATPQGAADEPEPPDESEEASSSSEPAQDSPRPTPAPRRDRPIREESPREPSTAGDEAETTLSSPSAGSGDSPVPVTGSTTVSRVDMPARGSAGRPRSGSETGRSDSSGSMPPAGEPEMSGADREGRSRRGGGGPVAVPAEPSGGTEEPEESQGAREGRPDVAGVTTVRPAEPVQGSPAGQSGPGAPEPEAAEPGTVPAASSGGKGVSGQGAAAGETSGAAGGRTGGAHEPQGSEGEPPTGAGGEEEPPAEPEAARDRDETSRAGRLSPWKLADGVVLMSIVGLGLAILVGRRH